VDARHGEQAPVDSRPAPDYTGTVENRDAAIARARAEAARIAADCPGLTLIVLFGSVARGGARADSDVDIGVLGASFWDGLKVGAELAGCFGREPHVVDLATANDLLRFQAAREGVPLFQGAPDAWPRFQAESAVRYFDVAPIIALCAEGARRRLAREAAGG
jgi:predicted nucleotidyltransferase